MIVTMDYLKEAINEAEASEHPKLKYVKLSIKTPGMDSVITNISSYFKQQINFYEENYNENLKHKYIDRTEITSIELLNCQRDPVHFDCWEERKRENTHLTNALDIKNNIHKLLFESRITNYEISKNTGIPQTTLGRFTTGKSDIGNMSLDNAIKLNDYYLKTKAVQ